MDLSKFFDKVQHDVLLVRVARKVHDKRLLKLIGRDLRAGVMVDGIQQPTSEGTMRAPTRSVGRGPLSPLLANILLDAFDKELERRELRFVRYVDDFLVFTKTAVAAERVYRSVESYLTRKLKLVVNRQKSRVCSANGVARIFWYKWLGYQFHGYSGQTRISPKSLAKLNERIHDIFNRNRGMSMTSRLAELRLFSMLDWLLCIGTTQDGFGGHGQADSPLDPCALSEKLALTTHPHFQTDRAWHLEI